jgi:hypothetical protein
MKKPVSIGPAFAIVFLTVAIITVLLLAAGICLPYAFPNPTEAQKGIPGNCFELGKSGFLMMVGLAGGKILK